MNIISVARMSDYQVGIGEIEELLSREFEVRVGWINHLKVHSRIQESAQAITFDYDKRIALDLFSERRQRSKQFALFSSHPQRAPRPGGEKSRSVCA